jgi:hypothetical protein
MRELRNRFIEEEVWGVISTLPPDKALGPGGFTACFLQSTWDIIRSDLMGTFNALWHMDTRELHSINEALVVLSFSSAPMNRISSCADRFLSFLRRLGSGLQREQMSNGGYSLQ